MAVRLKFKDFRFWGTWVVQSVKHLTLDLSSGFDLKVVSSGPTLGSPLGMEPKIFGSIAISIMVDYDLK